MFVTMNQLNFDLNTRIKNSYPKLTHICAYLSHSHSLSSFFSILLQRNQNAHIDFTKKKRTLQRLKRGTLPKNPTTVAEILAAFILPAVFSTYGKSLHENEDLPFYNGAVETKKFSYCVFSSRKTIELIEKHIPVENRQILSWAVQAVADIVYSFWKKGFYLLY